MATKLSLPALAYCGMVPVPCASTGRIDTNQDGPVVTTDMTRGGIPMTRLRLRRYALALCTVLLIPPLLWVGVVLIAPTDWATRHVVAALESGTRRSVRLDRLSVGWLGGVRLTNLEIGSPSHGDDPWLKARSVELDIGFFDLLGGNLRPRTAAASGVTLRVLRRADGTLEIADLIKPAEKRPPPSSRSTRAATPLIVQIQGGNLTIIDEPSQTPLAHARCRRARRRVEERKISISNLRGVLNGGPFQFVGELDRTGGEPQVRGTIPGR